VVHYVDRAIFPYENEILFPSGDHDKVREKIVFTSGRGPAAGQESLVRLEPSAFIA
jgi:hypothetical protein